MLTIFIFNVAYERTTCVIFVKRLWTKIHLIRSIQKERGAFFPETVLKVEDWEKNTKTYDYLINAENAFDKMQHSFMKNILERLGIQGA